ncbi:MAG: hypothetical protein JXR97_00570 [Planctomycetes bacterium]|nr:hypothetical protein [Planctomycetota bacterium]
MVKPQLTDLMNYQPPEAVMAEVEKTIGLVDNSIDLTPVRKTFEDTCKIFRGEYEGYRSCTNAYHDLDHTMHVFLAMAQLIHGASVSGRKFSAHGIVMGLIAAMFHDIGFIQQEGDTEGTGAKYTSVHEERGIQFMKSYFKQNGFAAEDMDFIESLIRCTCLREDFDSIEFKDDEAAQIGQILGSADLLGQMGDRLYLEKLPFLFREFKEAHIGGYENELDLLDKTLGFWEIIQDRMDETLGGMARYVQSHFRERYGIDRDLYYETIEEQIQYLQYVLSEHRDDYRKYLRRDKLMAVLYRMEEQDK